MTFCFLKNFNPYLLAVRMVFFFLKKDFLPIGMAFFLKKINPYGLAVRRGFFFKKKDLLLYGRPIPMSFCFKIFLTHTD